MTSLEMVFSIWLFLHRLKSKVRALSENEFNLSLIHISEPTRPY